MNKTETGYVPSFQFEKMDADQYRRAAHKTSRSMTIEASVQAISNVIGEPFRASEDDYPDDAFSTAMCWGIQNDEGDTVLIWSRYIGLDGANDVWSVHYKYFGLICALERAIEEESRKLGEVK